MRAPAGNTSMPLISGVCKLATCHVIDNAIMRAPASSYTIDNTSYAIDYEQERKLAACATDNTTIRAPASSYTVKSTSARASACNMPFNQRHHYRAPASSYAIDNSARASACNMPCHRQRNRNSASHRQRNRLRHHECASLQHAPSATPS